MEKNQYFIIKTFINTNFGVGNSNAKILHLNLGINTKTRVKVLKQKIHNELNKKINSKFIINKKLKEKINNNISFLIKNKSYKGIRHKLKYPVRGQRTHTNAKTQKKIKL
jgi:small subunit ribosomal protein S13